MFSAAVLAAALCGPARAQENAIDAALASRPGMQAAARATGTLPMGPALAVVFDGDQRSELVTFVRLKNRYLQIDTQGGPRGSIALEPAIPAFSNPYGDAAPLLAFRVSAQRNGGSVLTVLRYNRPYFDKAGEFPQGQFVDVDADHRLDVFFRARPLGRFFSVGCESLELTISTAFDAQVAFYKNGRYVEDAPRAKPYLEKRLRADEAALEAARETKNDNLNDFLGRALTVYFGHARLGRQLHGWKLVESALAPPAVSPPGLADCLVEAREKLRTRLHVGD